MWVLPRNGRRGKTFSENQRQVWKKKSIFFDEFFDWIFEFDLYFILISILTGFS